MIILDYSGITMPAFFSLGKKNFSPAMLRHYILNSIRMYNLKFRDEYGKLVIACDAGNSWRKEVFSEYKQQRKKKRDESEVDWGEVFGIINGVRDDLKQFFPYPVVSVYGSEADDIVATLIKHRCTSENALGFSVTEPTVIVSGDRDFVQLQKYDNVVQFSPVHKKYVLPKVSPQQDLKEHIIKGCKTDGVPNILSADDTFVIGERQGTIRKKALAEYVEDEANIPVKFLENYERNKKCIDFEYIPESLQKRILEEFDKENEKPSPGPKLLNYFIKNRLGELTKSISDFTIVNK